MTFQSHFSTLPIRGTAPPLKVMRVSTSGLSVRSCKGGGKHEATTGLACHATTRERTCAKQAK
jgi:hypothetical protein